MVNILNSNRASADQFNAIGDFVAGENVAAGDAVSLVRYDVSPFSAYEVVKASAASVNERINFVGFAAAAATTGNPVTIINSDFYTTTGLTANTDYFLSDTNGQISTTEGSIERIIGRAVSSTRLVRARGVVSNIINLPSTLTIPTQMYISNLDGDRDISINGQSPEGSMFAKAGDTVNNTIEMRARIVDTGYCI